MSKERKLKVYSQTRTSNSIEIIVISKKIDTTTELLSDGYIQ